MLGSVSQSTANVQSASLIWRKAKSLSGAKLLADRTFIRSVLSNGGAANRVGRLLVSIAVR